MRTRRTLEDGRVLHEGLGNRVARVIGRAIILVVLRVVVRKRGWVTLLRSLTARLGLSTSLRGLRQGLRRLRVDWRKTRGTVRLLRTPVQALDIIVTHVVPVEASRLTTGVGIIEILNNYD